MLWHFSIQLFSCMHRLSNAKAGKTAYAEKCSIKLKKCQLVIDTWAYQKGCFGRCWFQG